jgi:lipoprotein Spr
VRTGYDRRIGGYKPAPSEPASTARAESGTKTGSSTAKTLSREPSNKVTSAGATKQAATAKMAQENAPRQASSSSLEQLAKSWIGTPYVYGGSSKSGTDCSGYVMQLYKAHYGISLPHNAGQMYNDSRGSSVSRGSLQEGDLVFFGSFWKIDHVGIYLKGDRFTHASSSKGVIISPMNDNYWRPKYQGARRFR